MMDNNATVHQILFEIRLDALLYNLGIEYFNKEKMEKTTQKFNWSNWRNRWVWLNGKKLKLRHYISINMRLMIQHNKPGWEDVDHYLNYKIALSRYGLPGLKHYENRFYKNIPMPYNQTRFQKIGLWIANKIQLAKNWIKNLKK